MNLKYEVLGKSSFNELSRETKTSNVVTVPMNRSEKFSMSINKVKYASDQSKPVGTKVFNIWFMYNLEIVNENTKSVLLFELTTLLLSP